MHACSEAVENWMRLVVGLRIGSDACQLAVVLVLNSAVCFCLVQVKYCVAKVTLPPSLATFEAARAAVELLRRSLRTDNCFERVVFGPPATERATVIAAA